MKDTYQIGEPLVKAMNKGKIIVHRNFEGEHEIADADCWCRPAIIDSDDLREAQAIIDELEKADG